MIDVLNLALPFFGLIFIGFACGKLKQIPDTALAWMNFFILYVSLPALFYRILAQTPLEKLAQVDFIFATTLATFWAFCMAFAVGMTIRRGNIAESAIAGLAGGYGNIGFMGPGLALATLGPAAAVPVALIFCFDNIILFTMVPYPAEGDAQPRLTHVDGHRNGRKDIGSQGMDVANIGVVKAQLVKTATGIAPRTLQRQQAGIVVEAEADGPAAITHAVGKGPVGVGKSVEIITKAEDVGGRDTVAILCRQPDRVVSGRKK